MHVRVLHLVPDQRTDDIDLPLRVAENTREEGISESFEAFVNLEVIPTTDFFLRRRISSAWVM